MSTRDRAALAFLVGILGCHVAGPHPGPTRGAVLPKPPPEAQAQVGKYGLGTPISIDELAAWDIDVRPDGTGLPPGRGTVAEGARIYAAQCAACHGAAGEGVKTPGALLPIPALVGGVGSLASARPRRTIGSFWPYATTVYDYVYRAMPLGRAQSLSADETYAIVAYLLHLNGIVDADTTLDQGNLAGIQMPNRDGFFAPEAP